MPPGERSWSSTNILRSRIPSPHSPHSGSPSMRSWTSFRKPVRTPRSKYSSGTWSARRREPVDHRRCLEIVLVRAPAPTGTCRDHRKLAPRRIAFHRSVQRRLIYTKANTSVVQGRYPGVTPRRRSGLILTASPFSASDYSAKDKPAGRRRVDRDYNLLQLLRVGLFRRRCRFLDCFACGSP